MSLVHDIPVLGTHKESGADFNGEVLFVSPIPDDLVASVSPPLRWLLTPPRISAAISIRRETPASSIWVSSGPRPCLATY